jgi:protein CpxP
MKRYLILTILACGAFLAICPAMRAQDASPSPSTSGTGGWGGGGGRRGGGLNIDRLTTALTLTPDEVTKITPILDTLKTTMTGIRADTTLSQTDRMSKMKDARDDADTQIKAILTPDQQTKFDALLKQMASRRRGGGGGGGAAASPSVSGS